jgi:[protein-PII] uridylyltransferase
MSTTSPTSSLASRYAAESAKVREKFENTGDGRAAAIERTAFIDAVLVQLHDDHLTPGPAQGLEYCLVALGGYGRQELFPHSDIDLLFLAPDEATRDARREAVAALTRSLWDLGMRVGSSSRALAECGELHRDNLEFSVSLLDCRFVAGDLKLFERLRHDVIPRLVAREHQDLVRDLVEMTRRRHEKYGHTIFHLEPNIKEAPGGLRDYQVSRWLEVIRHLKQQARWEDPEKLRPPASRVEGRAAFDYLAATRTFLHYRQGRDDNHLTYEIQDQAAALGIGCRLGEGLPAAEWMRLYFRHARSIDRRCEQLLDDAIPVRTSLTALFRDWRSRQSTPDFRVERGRIFPRRPGTGAADPVAFLEIFELMACRAVDLSREAEHWVEEALPRVAARLAEWPGLWQEFRPVLAGPYSAFALRAMHRLGVLDVLFPEFRAIDSLVIRDFYHRYTVDEHSLMTIQNLNRLIDGKLGETRAPAPGAVWDARFSEILSELEQPDLLFLSLLFHDVGKGTLPGDHVRGSLEAVEAVLERLDIEPADRETVAFLISSHLEMSATMQRRDIFDPDTVRTLADKVGTPERLKMLCLLTYADIKSVNPEALTPWKAEKLWQLYAGTSNYLARSLDDERVHSIGGRLVQAERVLQLLPKSTSPQLVSAFLEGFPTRYLRSHSAEEIATHYQMSRALAENPVQLSLRNRGHSFELTVLIHDRPFLFASLTGTLAAWGMNIIKADAFANALGTVLDTFRFVDLHRTLELNPSEARRFEQSVVDVLMGRESLQALMSGRINPKKLPQAKVEIPTQVRFEDSPPGSAGSSRTSLLELITQDRPGLLYQVSSTLAELGFNIEVALIDTEGQKVIDVFYLTSLGAKLDSMEKQKVREALLSQL